MKTVQFMGWGLRGSDCTGRSMRLTYPLQAGIVEIKNPNPSATFPQFSFMVGKLIWGSVPLIFPNPALA